MNLTIQAFSTYLESRVRKLPLLLSSNIVGLKDEWDPLETWENLWCLKGTLLLGPNFTYGGKDSGQSSSPWVVNIAHTAENAEGPNPGGSSFLLYNLLHAHSNQPRSGQTWHTIRSPADPNWGCTRRLCPEDTEKRSHFHVLSLYAWTQGLVKARRVINHWAVSPVPQMHYLKAAESELLTKGKQPWRPKAPLWQL